MFEEPVCTKQGHKGEHDGCCGIPSSCCVAGSAPHLYAAVVWLVRLFTHCRRKYYTRTAIIRRRRAAFTWMKLPFALFSVLIFLAPVLGGTSNRKESAAALLETIDSESTISAVVHNESSHGVSIARRQLLGNRGGGGGGSGGGAGQPPSCLYPEMWEKVSAPGRKCCGNCKKCPKWATGDTLRVIGANHKSGTFLSIGVMASVREVAARESCLLAARTLVSVHWNGLDSCKACQPLTPNRPTLVMAFVRDPFELIVSGYLYHHAGKESWCTWAMRGGFRGGKRDELAKVDFGIATLLQSPAVPAVAGSE